MPGQLPHGKLIFVLLFIKPTVTGEMAVSSAELGRVTREKGPLGHGPCQKPEQCAISDARLVRGHCYGISPLLPLECRPQWECPALVMANV